MALALSQLKHSQLNRARPTSLGAQLAPKPCRLYAKCAATGTGTTGGVRGAAKAPPPELSCPDLQFPEDKWWIFSKAQAKPSIPQPSEAWWHSSKPWVLNIVNIIHWLAFPLGFWVAYNIYALYIANPAVLGTALEAVAPGDVPARVFCLFLGILSQTFSALTGLMMHEYEGWMISPFCNIIALPKHVDDNGAASKEIVEQVSVQSHNNAWLRSVAYYYLFLTQAFGLLCFAVGALGFQSPILGASVLAVAIMVLVPGKLQSNFKVNGQPVMPLSWAMIGVFAFGVCSSFYGYIKLFGLYVGWVGAIKPALLTAVGGIVEGAFAESFFNQWLHALAVVVMLYGLYLHTGLYYTLPVP